MMKVEKEERGRFEWINLSKKKTLKKTNEMESLCSQDFGYEDCVSNNIGNRNI